MIVRIEFPDSTEMPEVLVRDALCDFINARSVASYVENRFPFLGLEEAAEKRRQVERLIEAARAAVVRMEG